MGRLDRFVEFASSPQGSAPWKGVAYVAGIAVLGEVFLAGGQPVTALLCGLVVCVGVLGLMVQVFRDRVSLTLAKAGE